MFPWSHVSRLFIERHQFPNREFLNKGHVASLLVPSPLPGAGMPIHSNREEPAESFLPQKVHRYKDQGLNERHAIMRI